MALKPTQVEDLRRVFDHLDKDKSGSICAKEVLVALTSLSKHASLADAEALIGSADPSLDGAITFTEFKRALALKFGESASAAQMFETLDTDSSGLLSPDELRVALERYGLASDLIAVDEMIRCIDRDGDGMIGTREFALALKESPLAVSEVGV